MKLTTRDVEPPISYLLPERDGVRIGQMVTVVPLKKRSLRPLGGCTGAVVKITANEHAPYCVQFTPEDIARAFPNGVLKDCQIAWFWREELQPLELEQEDPWE